MTDELRAFLERRQSGCGATDSPGILGLSRWSTPRSIYLAKIEEEPTIREPSLPMYMGLQVQDTVAKLAASQMGIRVRKDNRQHRMPGADWMVCHLDYRELGNPDHLIEVKSVMSSNGYGEAGTENVPIDYWVQCQHEMAVTRATRVSLAVLFGHYDFRVFPIARNQGFIDKLVEACRLFWFENVLKGVPPPVMARDGALIEDAHPEPVVPAISATSEQSLLARSFKAAEVAVKEAEEARNLIKTQLKEIIGPAEGLRGPGFAITWKKDKDTVEVEWELVAGAYRKQLEEIDRTIAAGEFVGTSLTEKDLGAIESLYTTVKPGSRRFLMTWKEAS